jgi:tetratricopeptide (TPR) repeat protein
VLGVHQAAAASVAETPDGTGGDSGVPAYIPRDVDEQLRERLAAGGFVLLVGDSLAGKSRMAREAVSTLPEHVLVYPATRDRLSVAVDRAAAERRSVLWLDDLELYLGAGGLTPAQLGRLLDDSEHHHVVVATIRAAEQARITTGAPGNDAGRQTARDIRQVIGMATTIRIDRMFSADELERASARDWDPRIADAVAHAGSYGIAEYIAAGPELMREWEDARASSEGGHARGAALVAAAIDIRRAGYLSPLPQGLLDHVHEHYLGDAEHAHIPRESATDAWEWATRPRQATTALLRRDDSGLVEVFDYLVDTIQRRTGPLAKVPEAVVAAALAYASPQDADSIAQTAHAQGRYQTAEDAYRHAFQARAADPTVGPDHPDALATRNNLIRVLRDEGRVAEAERETRNVLNTMTVVLGRDHPDTLISRDTFALLLHARGRLEEARAEMQAVLRTMMLVLGPEHPDTLTSRSNLAVTLRDLGRLDEAEAEIRAVVDARNRVLGSDHADSLVARGILATVLREGGRLAEAEVEVRAVVDEMTLVLGPDHPFTLITRGHIARTLQAQGRLAEAEAEMRAIVNEMTVVLGPDHPYSVINRGHLALIMRDEGRLAEAGAEIVTVIDSRNRLLGPDHPETLSLANELDQLKRQGR